MNSRILVALRIAAPPEVVFDAFTDEHRGWDSVPAPHVARHSFPDGVFLQRHGEWWRALLAGLASRSNSVQLGTAGEGDP